MVTDMKYMRYYSFTAIRYKQDGDTPESCTGVVDTAGSPKDCFAKLKDDLHKQGYLYISARPITADEYKSEYKLGRLYGAMSRPDKPLKRPQTSYADLIVLGSSLLLALILGLAAAWHLCK